MDTDPRGMLLFHRDFRGFTGGHLKVWHYLRHAETSRRYRPGVFLTAASRRDASNPFLAGDHDWLQPAWQPERAEALFVAGLDWLAVPAGWSKPIINLVQGVRHASAGDPRRGYLSRRAVRICVSGEVADAIRSTGEVNGPVITIPNAIDVPAREVGRERRRTPLLVAGWKEPARTAVVVGALRDAGYEPEVIASPLPREEFLGRVAAAEVVLFLPLEEEGCFLPALEAFALGSLVVCPDCVGNRQFCRDGDTCLRPDHAPASLVAAVGQAMMMPPIERERMVAAARVEAAARGLDGEKRAFLAILDDLEWSW
jgi:glycosyltransferase involved in cell wall biosynthesis